MSEGVVAKGTPEEIAAVFALVQDINRYLNDRGICATLRINALLKLGIGEVVECSTAWNRESLLEFVGVVYDEIFLAAQTRRGKTV